MTRLTFGMILLGIALMSGVVFLSSYGTASAEIEGNCEAQFKGIDVAPLDSTSAGDAIAVAEDEIVNIVFTSSAGFASHKVTVQFADIAGTKIEADSDDDDGGDTQWSGSVNVDDWASYGAGLYRVEGSANLSDGTQCTGAVLVDVDKNPLTTVAGLVALGVGAVGAGSVAASTATSVLEGRRASRRIKDWVTNEVEQVNLGRTYTPPDRGALFGEVMDGWCLFMVLPAIILTGAAMATGGGGGATGVVSLPRASWRPRFSVSGTIGGILLGLGGVVLRQQYGQLFPDLATVVVYIVAGVALGIVLPSLIRALNVLSLNRALARAEARLAQAKGSIGGPPSATPATESSSQEGGGDVSSGDGGQDQ
ncbi:MAG: hypothetical protein ACE5FA_02665 [Dehalococcoidia bacterium]